jgi:hypothetical protein
MSVSFARRILLHEVKELVFFLKYNSATKNNQNLYWAIDYSLNFIIRE